MSSFTYDAPHLTMGCGQKLAPVSQQLEHSNFSSQEALPSYYNGLLNAQQGLVHAVEMQYTGSGKDCVHAASNDLVDFDATCTSRCAHLHSKLLGDGTVPQPYDASQLAPWAQRSYSQDAEVLDQDQLHGHQPSNHVEQQMAQQVAVGEVPVSRQQHKLQKKVWELEDMLEKISAAYESEQRLAPESNYLDFSQPSNEHVTPQMRMIVCGWLSEVASEFNMQQETLFLSVALLDRFMSNSNGVPRSALQLVAVACMLVAAKHEEVTHPNIEEFTDIAANCFQAEDLRRMERLLIDHLSWQIKTPTAYSFLHLYTQATAMVRDIGPLQHVTHQEAQSAYGAVVPGHIQTPIPKSLEPMSGHLVAKAAFLTELSMLDYRSLAFTPSQVAASALLLAQSWSEQGAAPQEIQQISGYSSADLYECMGRLLQLHQCAADCDTSDALVPFKHIKEKYAQDCWLHTSQREVPVAALEVLAPAAAGDQANFRDEDMGGVPSPSGFWK